MGIKNIGQQGIVFAVFAVLFAAFALFLPGFFTTANMLTLLQMVQDGYSLPTSLAAAFALTIVFGLINGWLIAYAEVPSLFTTLASGLFLAGLGQAALFKLDVVQWSPGLDGFERLGQGNVLGIPMPIVMFALSCFLVAFLLRRTRIGAYIYAVGDNPYAARVTGIPTRPIIVLQFVPDLRRDPGCRPRRHRAVGRPRRRPQRRHRNAADRDHAQRHDDHGRLLFRPESRQ